MPGAAPPSPRRRTRLDLGNGPVRLERVAFPDAMPCLSHGGRDLVGHGLPTGSMQAAYQSPGYDGSILLKQMDEEFGGVPNADQSDLCLDRALLEEAGLRPHQRRSRGEQPEPIPIGQMDGCGKGAHPVVEQTRSGGEVDGVVGPFESVDHDLPWNVRRTRVDEKRDLGRQMPGLSEARRARKLRTKRGAQAYKQHSQVEAVFGQMEMRGLNTFLLRGKKGAGGEWALFSATHNLLKLWRSNWRRLIPSVPLSRHPPEGLSPFGPHIQRSAQATGRPSAFPPPSE
ncbi:MAG: hypothetical protein EA422_11035 [Gemmatimonadales bacterium]|nr:MAG: hypothetical protein EA422_11035 [Gemmatimonadales bacterium]